MKKRYIISDERTVAVDNIIAIVLVPDYNNIRIDYGAGGAIFTQLIHFETAELMRKEYHKIVDELLK